MTNMELPKKFLNVVTVSITTIADVRNVNFENGSCREYHLLSIQGFLWNGGILIS